MTQEEKQLLLQDLCARLPYKPRVKYGYSFMGVVAISGYTDEGYLNYDELKDFSIFPKYGLERKRVSDIIPYLRPMSSMTEEESGEFQKIVHEWFDKEMFYLTEEPFIGYALSLINYSVNPILFNWLNEHHFDYRGLIPMGLALEAPKDMYSKQ